MADRIGAISVRLGIGRDNYRIAPGLYALGEPGAASPVLVTCNFKLTVDLLRRELAGRALWLLVVETYGINVWCAAGKKSFSTEEIAGRVRAAGLEKVVTHRRLILPQLAAPGVAAQKLRKLCGFSGVFGPVRADDLPAFLDADMHAGPEMRNVEFKLAERLKVALVEVHGARKFMGWILAACFLLALLGPGGFSFAGIAGAGAGAFGVALAGFLTGVFIVPAFLRRIPVRAFAAKGLIAGALMGLLLAAILGRAWPEKTAALMACAAFASWFAMHYTGSTPFTSLSGVDREMRRYMPVQAVLIVFATMFWLAWAWWGDSVTRGL
ncbi:MAG: carbon monoxide dehydrogenase [Desulfobacteraceae bacterium]|nr:MAG: carbon monoxide dehydrogenase [Desulfobacteraceae bacterium]